MLVYYFMKFSRTPWIALAARLEQRMNHSKILLETNLKEVQHNSNQFKVKNDGKGTSNPAIAYAAAHSLRLHPAQAKLAEATQAHPLAGMLGSLDEIQFLGNLVRSIGAKKTLEIGVFTGYSALGVALCLPDDGKVVACDVTDEYVNIGRPYWKEAGVEHKIDFRVGPATSTLEQLLIDGQAETFDFAFIDADKVNYDSYYELSLKLVRKGGIIAIDNTLWGGSVYDPDATDSSTIHIRALNEKVYRDERVYVSMLVLGDGTTLAFKK